MTVIRDMQAKDAEAVCDLMIQSWRNTYTPLIGEERTEAGIASRFTPELQEAESKDPDIISLVCEEPDGSLSGCAMASMDENRKVWLDRMHIVTEKHGTGLADDLIHAMLAKHAGLSAMHLVLIKENDRAEAFYRGHGFTITGETPDCGDLKDVPSIIMTKVLPRA